MHSFGMTWSSAADGFYIFGGQDSVGLRQDALWFYSRQAPRLKHVRKL